MALSDDPSTYTPVQQRFALNMAANAAGTTNGSQATLETALHTALTTLFTTMNGGWELSWGPRVYKNDPQVETTPPVNAWFVATSQEQDISVLAIAGTAPTSISGWLQDDDISKVIDWEAWVKTWSSSSGVTQPPSPTASPVTGTAYIAAGTAQGTANVLTCPSSSDQVDPGTLAYEYLAGPTAGSTIYVTGHSMGGAVSPVVALGLVEADLVAGRKVIVLSSAGASPGNDSFSTLWGQKFQKSGSGIDTINADFFNNSDFVPQAWNKDGPSPDRSLQNIFGTIFAQVKPSVVVETMRIAVKGAINKSENSGVDYLGIQGEAFDSTTPIPSTIPDEATFKAVFLQQHVIEYHIQYGVGKVVQIFEDALHATDGTNGTHN